VIALPDFPALRKLHALGVRRISAGPTLARLAFGTARNAAAAFLREGSLDALQPEASVEYGEMNALFSRD
ncbi:MAG: isocitrate lyase/phosphoenolpyruvate mutase family protein, partial [Candidatus Baltobacteraceae bacterium]